jgi:hypothetical protein
MNQALSQIQAETEIEALQISRAENYPTEMETLNLVTPKQADIKFSTPYYGMEKDNFSSMPGIESILLFETPSDGTFFILRINGHWEANIGGMMEEMPGELVDLFDETAGIFGFNK